MRCLGIDVSPTAVELANQNSNEYLRSRKSGETLASHSSAFQTHAKLPQVDFIQSDIFSPNLYSRLSAANCSAVDILVSNPPYISPTAFNHQTARSVRKFEPRIALVPSTSSSMAGSDLQKQDSTGDIFYPRLLELGRQTSAQIIALEVSDESQALRVAKLAERRNIWRGIEIWRDAIDQGVEGSNIVEYREGVRIRGSGNGRVVVCRRGGSKLLQL